MSTGSKIEWTDATWNPVTGCTEVSPGCAHCYAKRFAERFRGVPGHPFEHGFDLQLRPERLDEPLHWRKQRRVFVCSMADLFHEQVDEPFLSDVFAVMAASSRHTFQVLTKRPERMYELLSSGNRRDVEWWIRTMHAYRDRWWQHNGDVTFREAHGTVRLANVWLGVSIENDRYVGRADILRATPAAVRFISAEPLLGPLPSLDLTGIDWLIVGGESGPGARPMHPDWVRDLRDRAVAAGVAFFFKQWGEWGDGSDFHPDAESVAIDGSHARDSRVADLVRGHNPAELHLTYMHRVGARRAGRLLDGRTWDEYPR